MICGKFELKILCEFTNFLLFVIFFQYNLCVISRFFLFRPNPLQYFLVPDIEVENGEDEDDDEEIEEEIGKIFHFTDQIIHSGPEN